MKLYLTAAGIYAGTQVEAKADGKGWRLEEVPTDKYGLIDYLNKLKADPLTIYVKEPVTAQELQEEALAESFDERNPMLRQGPKGHRTAERAALMGTSDEIALLADRIGELDGQALGQIVLAACSRLKELAS